MTLDEAVTYVCGKASKGLLKHLHYAEILSWDDCTKRKLEDFRGYLINNISLNSARTYMSYLKLVLKRFEEEEYFYSGYRDVLKCKSEKPLKTYLTLNELKRLEEVPCRMDSERGVLYTFLISAYTGCRVSDAKKLTSDNISGNNLTYVSQKTSTTAVVPCKPQVRGWIDWLNDRKFDISLVSYNIIIRRLCRRARITDNVTTYRGGQTIKSPKWKVISSHSGRISFATNLAKLHTPLLDISRLMGHSDPSMTIKYIVPTTVELSSESMKMFM